MHGGQYARVIRTLGERAKVGDKVALNLDPANTLAVVGLGTRRTGISNATRRRAVPLRDAVQLDESRGESFGLLAVAAYYACDAQSALWAMRKALALAPGTTQVM